MRSQSNKHTSYAEDRFGMQGLYPYKIDRPIPQFYESLVLYCKLFMKTLDFYVVTLRIIHQIAPKPYDDRECSC